MRPASLRKAPRTAWRGVAAAGLLVGCSNRPPDVIIVSLDTLRADRVGAAAGAPSLTPNLDAFAAESVRFTQAYAPSNETRYSHAALFSGRYASELGELDSSFAIPTATPTLAALATAAGYDTGAFVAGGHMSMRFGLSGGFGLYDDAASWGGLQQTGPAAVAWLRRRPEGRPALLFVHSYDCHSRYLKPTPWGYLRADPQDEGLGAVLGRSVGGSASVLDGAALSDPDAAMTRAVTTLRFNHGAGSAALDPAPGPLSPAEVAELAALYDGAVAWTDLQFGLLMSALDEAGALDHSYVIVLSDHGEELGEAGHFGHRLGLDDVNLHVPLMVRPPGGAAGRDEGALVGLIDVAPTVLAMIGAPPLPGARGRSLLPLIDPDGHAPFVAPEAIFSEGALRLLSARGPTARLTAEGLSVRHPLAPALIAASPIDGAGLRLTGDPAAGPSLRAALAGWRSSLRAEDHPQ